MAGQSLRATTCCATSITLFLLPPTFLASDFHIPLNLDPSASAFLNIDLLDSAAKFLQLFDDDCFHGMKAVLVFRGKEPEGVIILCPVNMFPVLL
jgi:hypothetical protein